jgi:hypothetical protein
MTGAYNEYGQLFPASQRQRRTGGVAMVVVVAVVNHCPRAWSQERALHA